VIVKYVQPLVKMGATVTVLVAVDADHQYCWRPEVTLCTAVFAVSVESTSGSG
jgi:hypothetical protein